MTTQMTMNRKTTPKKPRGQGMTEYIIIVALIAIAAVGVVTIFGNNIKALFTASTEILAGATAASVSTKAHTFNAHKINTFSNATQEGF